MGLNALSAVLSLSKQISADSPPKLSGAPKTEVNIFGTARRHSPCLFVSSLAAVNLLTEVVPFGLLFRLFFAALRGFLGLFSVFVQAF